MGYRLYADVVEDGACFGKLFGYRDDEIEEKSFALDFLLRRSTFIDDNFDERLEDYHDMISDIVGMFGSAYHFECRMEIYDFLQFIMLYILEGAQRWKDEGETEKRCLEYMRNMMEAALAFCSKYIGCAEVKLTWG